MRVVCAMSGGVDSSVTAALLRDAGHEVIGITLHLYDSGPARRVGRCCAAADQDDARRVAAMLGIRHYTLDYRTTFATKVIDDFVRSYGAGETPTPCTHCNSEVKFGPLLETAVALGAERLATGHYARIVPAPSGARRLLRAVDSQKDQSYFLFSLSQATLARTVFPLGELTKIEVREQARRLGLPNADKPESMEVCFVQGEPVGAFVGRRLAQGRRAGEVVDLDGQRLGEHAGVHEFTIGQRKRLPVVGDGRPRYVVRIEARSGTIVVGEATALDCHELRAGAVQWIAGRPPPCDLRAAVQIRHRQAPVEAVITPVGDEHASVRFARAVRAVARGQAAVFYDGDEVVGGGWIES